MKGGKERKDVGKGEEGKEGVATSCRYSHVTL